MEFAKKYKHREREAYWQEQWTHKEVHAWRGDKPREETFVIDTPPPTVSGLLHMGHIFSYTHADFIARYQRMRGKDVFYPMGFDDNGLPTERLVEKTRKKRASDYDSREAFIAECESVSEEARAAFRELFTTVALSVDWHQEYHTISEEVRRISQASFLDLYDKGHINRKLQPMLWDPVDQTAIAQAEIEDKELEGSFNDIRFAVEDASKPSPSGRGLGEGNQHASSKLIEQARELRRQQTQPEDIIWHIIRNRQISGHKFRRQHPIGSYVVDFFCHEAGLIIELDGGHHGHDEQKGKDEKRQAYLEAQGYRVLRFWNNDIYDNLEGVYDTIQDALTLPLSQREREYVVIGTTRPEMIPACVAIFYHPDDERYQHLKGKHAITPLFGVRVPILEDDTVEPDKGTGIMMCCTFGDEADIDKWRKHDLPARIILNQYGKIDINHLSDGESSANEHEQGGGKDDLAALHGLKTKDARKAIISMLDEAGVLIKSEPITHMVKCAERSGAPLEILPTQQWFVDVLKHKDALKAKSRECQWKPEWMATRMEQWIDGLSWDWCISRQRYYGVPFPVWYSNREGEEGRVLLPSADQLPVNPLTDLPPGYSADEVTPDADVMDTWATSSLSPQINAGSLGVDPYADAQAQQRLAKLFPADLRPQAHEIIRTWAFYTLLKAHLHHETIPWNTLMISGWCLASDKTKMSKSKGNVVTPTTLIEEKGADAVRYWASTAKLGTDTAFSEDLLKIGNKLVTKLWNASKFAALQLQALDADALARGTTSPAQAIDDGLITETLDHWLLSRLHDAIDQSQRCFDAYDYAGARAVTEDVFWNDFCDNYLELVKSRAYGNKGEAAQASAVYTIWHALNALLKLFAPFVPHITEEIFSIIYTQEFEALGSIHARGSFPPLAAYPPNEAAEQAGTLTCALLELVRKAKSEQEISIKYPITQAWVAGVERDTLTRIEDDLMAAGNIQQLHHDGNAPEDAIHLQDEINNVSITVLFAAEAEVA